MDSGILYTLESANKIDSLCHPLKSIGITYFSYTKINKDGSRIDLNNHAEMAKKYYLETTMYADSAMEGTESSLESGFFLWSTFGDDPAIKMAQEKFQVGNGITLVESSEHITELWHFASHVENTNVLNLYINKQKLLKHFMYYFKSEADSLIHPKENNSINIITSPINLSHSSTSVHTTPIKDLPVQKYFLGANFNFNHLTAKEVEVVRYMSIGKTADEIGIILGNAPSTIRKHIEKIKLKLNHQKDTQIVRSALELDII